MEVLFKALIVRWIDEQSPSLLAAPQNKGNKGDPKKIS
jgi:hypothetical protein